MNQSRVLVTESSGLIGSLAVEYLENEGAVVFGVDNNVSDFAKFRSHYPLLQIAKAIFRQLATSLNVIISSHTRSTLR